jgi:hypothetical protein
LQPYTYDEMFQIARRNLLALVTKGRYPELPVEILEAVINPEAMRQAQISYQNQFLHHISVQENRA